MRAGKGATCSIKEVTWLFGVVVGPVSPKVGDVVRFGATDESHPPALDWPAKSS